MRSLQTRSSAIPCDLARFMAKSSPMVDPPRLSALKTDTHSANRASLWPQTRTLTRFNHRLERSSAANRLIMGSNRQKKAFDARMKMARKFINLAYTYKVADTPWTPKATPSFLQGVDYQ